MKYRNQDEGGDLFAFIEHQKKAKASQRNTGVGRLAEIIENVLAGCTGCRLALLPYWFSPGVYTTSDHLQDPINSNSQFSTLPPLVATCVTPLGHYQMGQHHLHPLATYTS